MKIIFAFTVVLLCASAGYSEAQTGELRAGVAKVDISEARDLAPIEELPPPLAADF